MQVSIGVYALIYIFLFIVFPGFIGRRFYYNGEFSKQVNWRNNLLGNFFYSFIVGLILTIVYVFTLNSFKEGFVNIDKILNNFDENYLSPQSPSSKHNFDGFSQSFNQIYLPYISLIYFASAVIGYFTSKFIQIIGFDSRFKILRYSNNWHYLFSGKIMKLGSLKNNEQNKGLEIRYTYLDVLVLDSSTTLYSGLYGDYELNHLDLNKLEKLHLYKAKRYKKMSNGETKLVEIPGDVFTIMGKNIININCTYIPKIGEEDDSKIFNILKMTLRTAQLFKWLVFVLFTFTLFIPLKGLDFNSYNTLVSQSIFVKILCVFGLNTCFGLITPFQINEESKKIEFNGWANYRLQLLTNIIVFGLIYFLFV